MQSTVNKHMPLSFRFILAFCIVCLATATPASSDTDTQPPAAESAAETDGQPAGQAEPGETGDKRDPNRGRFLPIPIFITEPAIGEGLGLALTYFHRVKQEPQQQAIASPASIGAASKERSAPPTMTAVFAAYTRKETAAAGIGHMNTFRDDHIRFTGAAAVADVNSTFYLLDQPFEFNLKGSLLFQETRFRLRDSAWFLGIGLSYLDATNTFKVSLPDDTTFGLFATDLTNVGLAGKLAHDTRDNTAMPNSGRLFELGVWRYDESIGGDYEYWNTNLKVLTFHRLHEKFVLGGRLEYSLVDGKAPFFAIPWVKLRGIAAMRYQGEKVATAELEGRYDLAPRWALLGFAGTGWVSSYDEYIDTEQSIYNYGLGARYKIFDAQNVWVGIDVARGPESYNWYIQVGNAW